MAMMTMKRDFTVKSLGHSVRFKADHEQWVPSALHSEALKYGAVAVDQKEDLDLEKAPERPKVVTGEDRDEALQKAMVYLKFHNDGSDFGANGLPKVKAVASLVGFDVSGTERDVAWTKMMKAEIAKGQPETNDG